MPTSVLKTVCKPCLLGQKGFSFPISTPSSELAMSQSELSSNTRGFSIEKVTISLLRERLKITYLGTNKPIFQNNFFLNAKPTASFPLPTPPLLLFGFPGLAVSRGFILAP